MSSPLLVMIQDRVEALLEEWGLTTTQGAAIGAGTLAALYLLFRRVGRKKYKLAPGPFQLPILGNSLQLMFSKLRAEKNFLEMSKTYGPVIRSNILGMEFIVLNNIDVIREAVVIKADHFSNRPIIWSLTTIMADGGKDIIMGQPTPVWKYQRQIVHQAIRKYASGETLEQIIRGIHEKLIGMIKKKSGPQDVHPLAQFLTYNWMFAICFGKEYPPDHEELIALQQIIKEFQDTMSGGSIVDFMPSMAYCPLVWPQMNRIISVLTRFKNILIKNIAEHKEAISEGDGATKVDLTDYILAQQTEEAKGNASVRSLIDEQFLMQTISDVFGAGIDTTTTVMEYLIGYMAKYPEVQERMYREIKAVYVPSVSLLDIRNEIPYLEAVLYEIMRKETIAPFGIPLMTGNDTSVGGFDVPKDTTVLINTWALHNNPAYWDKPEQFNPDRFLEEDGSLKQGIQYFIPFSLGRRQCIGEVLSKSSLFMFSVLLFDRFEFRIPSDCPEWELRGQDIPMVNYPKLFQLDIRDRQ